MAGSSSEFAFQTARQIFRYGVDAVIPSNLIRNQVKLHGSILKIQQVSVDLKQFKHSYVVGFGKAVLPMAEELLSIVNPDKIDRCILSVPEGTRKANSPKIEIYQGARNNAPDAGSFQAAQNIVQIVQQCMAEDLLIVLISGGGSACLPFPRPPITLQEKAALFKQLSTGGATINDLNSVRKAISMVKGGGLVQLCGAGRIVSLILSDVLGDKLDVIASGPTVRNTDQDGVAATVVRKYLQREDKVAPNIRQVLANASKWTHPPEIFKKVDNIVLGNNTIALEACARQADKENLIPVVLTSTLEGDARAVGVTIAKLCSGISTALNTRSTSVSPSHHEEIKKLLVTIDCVGCHDELISALNAAKTTRRGICLLLGGETTVNVKGTGRGGRNQELALSAALHLHDCRRGTVGVTILSAGTDGIDGPCTAAGAVVDGATVREAEAAGLRSESFLDNNDSFSYFSQLCKGKFHLVTGHTGTNVMDIVVAIVEQQNKSSL